MTDGRAGPETAAQPVEPPEPDEPPVPDAPPEPDEPLEHDDPDEESQELGVAGPTEEEKKSRHRHSFWQQS